MTVVLLRNFAHKWLKQILAFTNHLLQVSDIQQYVKIAFYLTFFVKDEIILQTLRGTIPKRLPAANEKMAAVCSLEGRTAAFLTEG